MGTRLAGKVAVVTGAGRGIGAEIARVFAAEGARVVVADIDAATARAVAGEIRDAGGTALASETDISSAAQVDALFLGTAEAFDGLDILVNNAFFNVRDVTIVDLDEADWDKTLSVSLKGPFLCTRRALPMMKERGGGSVVTLSSVNALFGVSETAYTAAKGGLISLMRLVAAEYGAWNIRSNVICPGTVGTQFCLDYWQRFPAGFAKLMEMYPLGRIGTPRDVANYALFLASDESAWVTGSVAVIDGGLLAGRKFEV
jgi:NAD(P)-dependent dehydrogenase (short-subunit alcohol dehydrogenase family)